MKRFFATVFTLGILMLAPLPALAQSADSNAHIHQVIESFRSAIRNKDKDAFLRLFLKDDITWSGVTTDASIERLYATRPDPKMKRPFKIFDSTPRRFIDAIVADKAQLDETISNVRIDADADVAQVWFDYTSVTDGYKQNWGKESWQMVRTDTGWKIAAVVWSQELNPLPPPKSGAR